MLSNFPVGLQFSLFLVAYFYILFHLHWQQYWKQPNIYKMQMRIATHDLTRVQLINNYLGSQLVYVISKTRLIQNKLI